MNGQLFTQDFLARGIATSPVWTAFPDAQLGAFVEALRSVYAPYSASSELNEAITESEIIVKVLAQLGWSDLWLPQVTASGARREDVPDFLLYPDEVAKAHSLKEKLDVRRYRRGIAILEAKRWMRVLDRGDATDRLGPGTPSNQILRYLSAAEVASDRAVRWGVLTNGAIWRLYYQGARSRSEDFLEIDLAAALGVPGTQPPLLPKDVAARHVLKTFFCFFHRAAFLPQSWDVEKRTFHEYALAETRQYEERVSDDLGQRVFGTVFPDLADALASGDPSAKAPYERPYLDEVREAALILLYRLLFVLYAEDRELLPVRDKRYAGYSLRRLREEVSAKRDASFAYSSSASRLWDELTNLFRAITNGDKSLGLPAYNGGLFDDTRTPILARAKVPDAKLAPVIDELSRRAWINYRDLSVQHLGSIYERLLEYRLEPQGGRLVARPNSFARRGSGSYYTHDDLVKLLIAETVGPLTAERVGAFDALIADWKGRKELKPLDWAKLDATDPASRMLELRVCDPAMGSGHFLVALVDDLADRILEFMSHAAELVADQRWAKNIKDAWVSPVAVRIADIRRRILAGMLLPGAEGREAYAEWAPLLQANIASFALDYCLRQKVQGQNINWYMVEQLPLIRPEQFATKLGKQKIGDFVRGEVLRLSYTAWDLKPFARDLGYEGGPLEWDEEDRRHRIARLDALFFHLYGIKRDDAEYILETFPIVREQDEKAHGRFLTKDLVLAYLNAVEAGDLKTTVNV